MTIHIYFTGDSIPDKSILILGTEDVFSAINNKLDEIHTTELFAISYEIAEVYDYVFHYRNEEVSISKSEMDMCWFSNAVGRIYNCYNCSNKDFNILCKNMFDIAMECKTNYSKVLEEIDQKEKEILSISNIFDYIRFRLKEILKEEHMYILVLCLITSEIFLEKAVLDKVALLVFIGIFVLFNEGRNFCETRKDIKNNLKGKRGFENGL